jgi:hypothetical protein
MKDIGHWNIPIARWLVLIFLSVVSYFIAYLLYTVLDTVGSYSGTLQGLL